MPVGAEGDFSVGAGVGVAGGVCLGPQALPEAITVTSIRKTVNDFVNLLYEFITVLFMGYHEGGY